MSAGDVKRARAHLLLSITSTPLEIMGRRLSVRTGAGRGHHVRRGDAARQAFPGAEGREKKAPGQLINTSAPLALLRSRTGAGFPATPMTQPGWRPSRVSPGKMNLADGQALRLVRRTPLAAFRLLCSSNFVADCGSPRPSQRFRTLCPTRRPPPGRQCASERAGRKAFPPLDDIAGKSSRGDQSPRTQKRIAKRRRKRRTASVIIHGATRTGD